MSSGKAKIAGYVEELVEVYRFRLSGKQSRSTYLLLGVAPR